MLHWSERHCKPELLHHIFDNGVHRDVGRNDERTQIHQMRVIYQHPDIAHNSYGKETIYDPRPWSTDWLISTYHIRFNINSVCLSIIVYTIFLFLSLPLVVLIRGRQPDWISEIYFWTAFPDWILRLNFRIGTDLAIWTLIADCTG